MAKRTKRRARKRGRPPTGRDPVITVRLTRQLQRALALLMERHAITRSGAIRCLLNAGVNHSYWIVDPKRNVAYEGDTPGLRRLARREVAEPSLARGRRTRPAADPVPQIVKSRQKDGSAEGPRNFKGVRRIKLEPKIISQG